MTTVGNLTTWAESHHPRPVIDYKIFAVLGSREFTDADFIWRLVRESLPRPCIVVSGGARGVDTFARTACDSKLGIYYKPLHVLGAEWEKKFLGKRAGPIRNDTLTYYLASVNREFKDTAMAIVVVNYPITSGSNDAVQCCIKHEVPYKIIFRKP